MTTITTHQPSASHTSRRIRRLVTVVTAIVAAVALWAVIVHAAGFDLRTPAFAKSQTPVALNVAIVAVVGGLVGFAAWGVLALLERTTQRPRRVWISVALVTLVVSLGGPLSGHGVSGANRALLASLHILVAVILINGLGRTAAVSREIPEL